MKIGVIAGTPVDTRMGVDYVRSMGFQTVSRACSESPEEQMGMQVLQPEVLTERVIALCNEMVCEGTDGIFVNCNSLTAAVDMPRIRANVPQKIVTPLDVYRECASDYHVLGVIAANGQSLAAIERVIMDQNPSCHVFGAALKLLVIAIEHQVPPDEIFEGQGLAHLNDFVQRPGGEALILGCTHFPYILPQLERCVTIPIINPSERMLDMLTGA